MPKLVCVSDTHLAHDFVVPDGDILVHAGDLTGMGTYIQIAEAGKWLASLPHKHKVVIAGNHDFLFERDLPLARLALGDGLNGIVYLQDSGIELEGLRFWGSPWTPRFYDWAFQLNERDYGSGQPNSEAHWARLSSPIDVLVTHGPPHNMLDRTVRGNLAGDKWLAEAVARVAPKVHVFGHIHSSSGHRVYNGIQFINAAVCDEFYDPTNPIITVEV